MAGFDTTDVAAKVNPQVQNPIEVIGGLANAQNAFNQNKLFDAKALAGQYLEQATGPDGQPDLNQFTAALKQDKRTSPFALEILQGTAGLRQTGIQNETQQRALNQASVDELRKATAIYGNTSQAKDDKIRSSENSKSVLSAITKLVRTGAIDAKIAAQYTGSGDMANDIRAASISGIGGDIVRQGVAPNIDTMNTGGSIVAIAANPLTGELNKVGGTAAVTPMTMTVAEKIARNSGVDPETGKPFTAPNAATTTPTGDVKADNGITGPHGEIQTGLEPGQVLAKENVAKTASDQVNALVNTYAGSAQREALLKEMLAAKSNFRSGPGAAKWSGLITEANRVLGTNFSAGSTPSQQVFGKIAEQLALQQRNALGASPTDLQTELARQMSANNENSDEANLRVAAMQLGNEKLIQAEQKAWDHAKNQLKYKETDFPHFQANFNSHADPRFFQEEFMTPGQVQEMHKNMSATQLERYQNSKKRFMAQFNKLGN